MTQQEIGERLRALRKEKQMNLKELAQKSGVSTGLISQIERGLVAPSVVSLYHIGQALGADISYFFTSSSPAYTLQRAGEHRIIVTNHGLDKHTMLSNDRDNRQMDMVILELKGGETYDKERLAHAGEECVYVISGELTILIDEESIVLKPGDSLHFSSNHPHLYINAGKEDSVSIWSIAPHFF